MAATPSRKEPVRGESTGGIPDGLLVGGIAFLLGTVLTAWLATGIAGWFQHGRWPAVRFAHTALALRHLAEHPSDIEGAWSKPHPVSGLPSPMAFWLTTALLVLLITVLVAFAVSTWTTLKGARRDGAGSASVPPLATTDVAAPSSLQPPDPTPASVPPNAAAGGSYGQQVPPGPSAAEAPVHSGTGPLSAPGAAGVPASPAPPAGTASMTAGAEGFAAPEHVPADAHVPGVAGVAKPPGGTAASHPLAEHALLTRARTIRPEIPVIGRSLHDVLAYGFPLGRDAGDDSELYGGLDQTYCVFGPPRSGRTTRVVRAAVEAAPGPVLVTCEGPETLEATLKARAKAGPVAVFDPLRLTDSPHRLRWSPVEGCEDPQTADGRARALLEPVRPLARTHVSDSHTQQLAHTLLRCWLHAAALDRRPIRQVHRWSVGQGARDAVKILRTAKGAAADWAGALESTLSGHEQQLEAARALTARALESLTQLHVLNACTPSATERFRMESFLSERGTMYVVGEGIEDPRTNPGVMPLTTALVENVVEHGRRMAATSPSGRLDPPLLAALDDVATVAPIPGLPYLMSLGGTVGIPTIAVLRSEEQARHRWGDRGATTIRQAADVRLFMAAPGTARIELGDRPQAITSTLPGPR